MCSPASFIVTKTNVFWSKKSDSHEDIIEEHKIHMDGMRGPNAVRVEITPPDGDMKQPFKLWRYHLDQDIRPKWYDAKDAEKRARVALKEWAKAKLLLTGEREVKAGEEVYAFGNSQVTACGNSKVMARENSQVTACGNSKVMAWGNSQVTARENSKVTAWGNSKVTAWENSQVTARENSKVMAWGNSQVTARENSQVMACEHNATVRHSSTTEPVQPKGPLAVVIDCRADKAVCVVGT